MTNIKKDGDHEIEAIESIEIHRRLRHHHHKNNRQKRLHELYQHPGIRTHTVHGLMIDAGSTGSRLHVYEWKPRVLETIQDIEAVAQGELLSFPDTNTRWTDRLRPGLASFASLRDDIELHDAIAEYLSPLIEFAKTILHSKRKRFDQFPIYLRATAGMRMLHDTDRARLMKTVRDLLSNPEYSPFLFANEQARVLSGEEEAAYDWTAVNFLTGDLLHQSEGAGVVIDAKTTHGALDLGGASTQISFFQSNNDVMSNLFKLQIGQAKHWNIYAHSFLFFGINEAINRFHAGLVAPGSTLVKNPCLPAGESYNTTTHIHFHDGMETWSNRAVPFQVVGDPNFEACLEQAELLLHLDSNSWCDFAHREDCSLAGVYQPSLPDTEFVAFSNYYHIWNFLGLQERATIAQLDAATREACSLSWKDLQARKNRVDGDVETYCFRSTYALQLLKKGYGFHDNNIIRVSKVINGQKVGWALGAMLYEINTLPWQYTKPTADFLWDRAAMVILAFCSLVAVVGVLMGRERRLRRLYEPVKDIETHGGLVF